MGRTITLAEVREAVRVRYDLPAFSTSSFVTTAMVHAFINGSLQTYYGLLNACFGDDYFAATVNLTTTAGVATTALPPRFVKLKTLMWERVAGDVVLLRRAQIDDISVALGAEQGWTSYEPRYRLFGTSTVRWFPKPDAVYTVACDYIQLPADLTADADTFEAGPGHEEYVILDVCKKIAQREEKSLEEWAGLRSEIEARIRSQAPERDETDGLVLRDAWGRGESDYTRYNRHTLGDY